MHVCCDVQPDSRKSASALRTRVHALRRLAASTRGWPAWLLRLQDTPTTTTRPRLDLCRSGSAPLDTGRVQLRRSSSTSKSALHQAKLYRLEHLRQVVRLHQDLR